jgi:epoxyqueuosine reductase
MNKIQIELTELLKANGAVEIGFADLRKLPEDTCSNYSTGISILVKLNPDVITEIKTGPTQKYCEEYKRINNLLDNLADITSEYLIAHGYIAHKTSSTIKTESLYNGIPGLPHKTSATLSGLGWIGKCALLITEKYGSAVRLTTVFTNALFDCGTPIVASSCGQCSACVKRCPGKAVLGNNWRQGAKREEIYNMRLCREAVVDLSINQLKLDVAICGICIANCPYTLKYIKRK